MKIFLAIVFLFVLFFVIPAIITDPDDWFWGGDDE